MLMSIVYIATGTKALDATFLVEFSELIRPGSGVAVLLATGDVAFPRSRGRSQNVLKTLQHLNVCY